MNSMCSILFQFIQLKIAAKIQHFWIIFFSTKRFLDVAFSITFNHLYIFVYWDEMFWYCQKEERNKKGLSLTSQCSRTCFIRTRSASFAICDLLSEHLVQIEMFNTNKKNLNSLLFFIRIRTNESEIFCCYVDTN